MRRLSYYAVVVVGAAMIHAGFFPDVVGGQAADFFRRNSEGYVVMALVPAFWDIFAWAMSPGAAGRPTDRGSIRPWSWHAAWLGMLATAAVATQSSLVEELGIDLPQSVITLGEAFVATVAISVYLAWSRGLFPSPPEPAAGAPVVSWRHRLVYYAAVGILAGFGYQALADSILGGGVADWLQLNAEALGAALLIPVYFDVVARSSRRIVVRIAWYAILAVVPILAQSGALDGVAAHGLVDWLTRITEAFLAAIVITIYFDVWRGSVHHGDALNGR